MNNPILYWKITVILMVFTRYWHGIDPIFLKRVCWYFNKNTKQDPSVMKDPAIEHALIVLKKK